MDKPPLIALALGAIVLIGVLLIGRGGGNQVAQTTPDSQTAESSSIASPSTGRTNTDLGPQVPDLELTNLTGGQINLNQYAGQKAVIVDFWASWCHNCQRDMPRMQALYDQYKDTVEILAVNLQESKRDIERFVSSRHLTYPILLDPTGKANRVFGITYTNTHILISKSGNILGILPGDISEADVQQLIAAS